MTLDLNPPRQAIGSQAMLAALLAHVLLVAALTWGTAWRQQAENITVAAELWAAIPAQAAPPLVVPPATKTAPDSAPAAVAPLQPPQIVTEKSKPLPHKSAEPEKAVPLESKAAKDRREAAQQAQEREMARQDTLKRMQGMANATGSNNAVGSTLQSTGLSASYGAKVKSKVRPNLVFPDASNVAGNPVVEVIIKLGSDGSITLPLRLAKSSGNAAFDNAVLRAIERTESLPRDTDGRYPPPFTLAWSMKE